MSELLQLTDTYGRRLMTALGALNEWAALLLLGAITLDHLLARRVRASWRIALYAPLVVRILLPRNWMLSIAHAPHAVTLLTPVPIALPPPAMLTYTAPSLGWPAAVVALYASVALLFAYGILRRRVDAERVLDDARPVSDDRAPLRLPCPLVEHPSAGPMVVGLVRPHIVLPSQLLHMGDSFALATVLRHEIAHVSRRDAWLAAAMQLTLAVFWPVLPLWAASWRVRQLMEVACDESALDAASPAERRDYGHALLDLAELRSVSLTPMLAELHFGSTLRARVLALRWTRRWPVAVQVALVGGVAAAFGACSSVAPATEDRIGKQAQVMPKAAQWVAPLADEFELAIGKAPVAKYCGPLIERIHARWPRSPEEFSRFGPDWVSTVERLWMSVPADDLSSDQLAFCRSARGVAAARVSFWADEARNGLGQIGRDTRTAFEARRGEGNPTLCPSAPPIPKDSQAPNTPHVQTTPSEWNDGAGFECLRFSFSMPTYFQYRTDNDATHFSASAHAQRMIEGHIVDVTVVLRGEVNGRELTLSPSLEETWRVVD